MWWRWICRRAWSDRGYAVIARVATGEAAIEEAGTLCPDPVLMDITIHSRLEIRPHWARVLVVQLAKWSSGQVRHCAPA